MKLVQKLRKFGGGGNTPISETNSNALQYEICVACGKKTDVLCDTPVTERKNYIHGCGQLCEKCMFELLRDSESESFA